MMENKKPLTDNRRQKLNDVYYELKKATPDNPLTKAWLRDWMGFKERQSRDLISEVARKYPVVSLSSGKGYYLLPDFAALNNAEMTEYTRIRDHAVAELESRIEELKKRIEPLKAWGF